MVFLMRTCTTSYLLVLDSMERALEDIRGSVDGMINDTEDA